MRVEFQKQILWMFEIKKNQEGVTQITQLFDQTKEDDVKNFFGIKIIIIGWKFMENGRF